MRLQPHADNQEAYQDCDEETGAVLVFEILERQSDVSDEDACDFFMGDLAESNEAEEHVVRDGRVVNVPDDGLLPKLNLPSSWNGSSHRTCACVARGSQRVARERGSRAGEPGWIDVEMCVMRLAGADTDLLVTLSSPRRGSEVNDGGGAGGMSDVFGEVLRSFCIKDWSLFG